MKIRFIILFVFFQTNSFSQEIYLEKVAKVAKRTYTYDRIKKSKNLKLDFYKPKKIKGKLPLLLYVHGGGFSGGKRNEQHIVTFAEEMASRGYAVASISYRLTMKGKGFGCNTKSVLKRQAFDDASNDVSKATNYILKRKKRRLDAEKVILIGSSAGAEAVLNLAYVQNNTILPNNFKFAGVIGLAGAITTIENITESTAIPTQLFHGTKDNLVPYDKAPHHYCDKSSIGYLELFGSKAIAEKLKILNTSFYLFTIENGNHDWASRPMQECKKEILDFLYYDVLQKSNRQIETGI